MSQCVQLVKKFLLKAFFFFFPSVPNQLNLKLKCGYMPIWVNGGDGAGTDSKIAILVGGGEA